MNVDHVWLMLTPAGVLRAFGQPKPDAVALDLQRLLMGEHALSAADWLAQPGQDQQILQQWLQAGWVQMLARQIQGPDARLDDFLQHVIAALSGERRAVLASDSGFCLGRCGVEQDEAEILSAAAADYTEFAKRQARRGWVGASGYVAFHQDPEFLLPTHSFVPFWVDETGYWLILLGEPLLNNSALVELFWGIKEAGTRFTLGS